MGERKRETKMEKKKRKKKEICMGVSMGEI